MSISFDLRVMIVCFAFIWQADFLTLIRLLVFRSITPLLKSMKTWTKDSLQRRNILASNKITSYLVPSMSTKKPEYQLQNIVCYVVPAQPAFGIISSLATGTSNQGTNRWHFLTTLTVPNKGCFISRKRMFAFSVSIPLKCDKNRFNRPHQISGIKRSSRSCFAIYSEDKLHVELTLEDFEFPPHHITFDESNVLYCVLLFLFFLDKQKLFLIVNSLATPCEYEIFIRLQTHVKLWMDENQFYCCP